MHFHVNLAVLVLTLIALKVKSDSTCDNTSQIVCYFGSWAMYRVEDGKFTTENIDPTLCTKIIYTFAGLDIYFGISSLDTNADIIQGGFANTLQLKEQNPCLKVVLAIGGWNEGSLKYSVMASSSGLRNAFASSVLRFLSFYGFDGLDFDWEYPTSRGGILADKSNFVLLLKELHSSFQPWGFQLSIAVPINVEAYDIKGISDYVDYVHFMAYDYTVGTSKVTGLLAPLSEVTKTVNAWISGGLPASKLILGIPTYGRCFNLADKNNHDVGAPVSGNVTCGGEYTNEDGFLAYYEIKAMFEFGMCDGSETVDDNNYAYCGGSSEDDEIWMSYDSEETVATKTRYALNAGLGGVMLWSLDTDDFLGSYGEKYPLLRSINKIINPSK